MIARSSRVTRSKDNLKSLGTSAAGIDIERPGALSPYKGKNYVLAIALTKGVDLTKAENLDLLFSPWVPVSDRPGPQAYAGLTLESLKTKQHTNLTSYERVKPPPGGWKTKTGAKPVLADFTPPDAVIVFLSNGRVEEVTREQYARY